MVSIYIRRFQCREDLLPILMTAGLLAFLPPGWIEIPDNENAFAALTQVEGFADPRHSQQGSGFHGESYSELLSGR